jgi:transcriptional regulator with XRE-family HTH domain
MPAAIAASKTAASPVGTLLREWRASRRMSQLELSLESGVSARHLSCVETGRAGASREVLYQLAEALEMPLRDRNALLLAAGYAPQYRETDLEAPELALIRRAIDATLAQQEPFPAFVVNRYWDVLQVNGAMTRLLAALRPEGPRSFNIIHQVFDPDDLRDAIDNWDEVAFDLLQHVQREAIRTPSDKRLRELLELALRNAPSPPDTAPRRPGAFPVLTTVFRQGDLRLRFFSTLTRFGTASEVAVEEAVIECMHPADDATRAYCQRLAG